ncbi:MAG: DUF6457 domain-containing protein [Nocardioidaceae bacterium]
MTLHDWIDELCDTLDIDIELDEALILDLARDAAHSVERTAAPITAYLLGYAAAVHGASPEAVEELAARATELANKWGGEEDEDEFTDVEVEEDDSLVDVE